MDPKANLEEQRQLVDSIIFCEHDEWEPEDLASVWETRAVRLAKLVRALDKWRSAGGADPYLS